jgi:hypothetical protein
LNTKVTWLIEATKKEKEKRDYSSTIVMKIGVGEGTVVKDE